MTKNESFKRRIRERMTKTGEKYGAARRSLLAASSRSEHATTATEWVSNPGVPDDQIRENTGHSWNEWREIIDAWPGHTEGHTAIARYVATEHGVADWWAQGVTVGYERMTGRRATHQRSDGTFVANVSRTVRAEAAELREALLDEAGRTEIFPGLETELRSRPGSKSVRLGVEDGVALFSIEERSDGRIKVTVAHEKLPDAGDVDRWKAYWRDWLEALNDPEG